jgi:arylsulfatase
MKLTTYYLTGISLIALSSLPSCNQQEEITQNTSPNIIIIFTDDQGYGDLGCFGATGFETPNLDRMANEGIRFTHFYVSQAVCSASRAALMTGCYSNRVSIYGALSNRSKNGIHENEMTLGELVKQKEYATAVFGKWHLGHYKQFLPLQNGFDEYLGLPYSNDMWPVDYDGTPVDSSHRKFRYIPLPLIEGNEVSDTLWTLEDQGTLTTLYTEKAVDFINRNAGNPFLLYVPHSMPHVPVNASDKFLGKSKQGLYGDVMMEIDWSVGEILKALKENGISDNTLVIFTTDNGPWLNYGNHAGTTGGLREGKGTAFEGGQRVPCIMRWPSVIPEGKICNELGSTLDILPTIAEITGTSLPDHKIDGISLLPLLKGDFSDPPRKEFYYYYGRTLRAVRKDQWKLVFPHQSRTYLDNVPANDGWPGKLKNIEMPGGLYNLRRDPGERYDVSELYPEIVAELGLIADKARTDLGDQLQYIESTGHRDCGYLEE